MIFISVYSSSDIFIKSLTEKNEVNAWLMDVISAKMLGQYLDDSNLYSVKYLEHPVLHGALLRRSHFLPSTLSCVTQESHKHRFHMIDTMEHRHHKFQVCHAF